MSFGRILWLIAGVFVVAAFVYTGLWHVITQFMWQNPMLSWLPIVGAIIMGFLAGGVIRLIKGSGPPPPSPAVTSGTPAAGADLKDAVTDPSETAGPSPAAQQQVNPALLASYKRPLFNWGWALLAFLFLICLGVFKTWIVKPAIGLDDIDYEVVSELPQETQPRLLPRSGIKDDRSFKDASEIHLVRDPNTGKLLWTGEWQGSWLGSESVGIAVKPLDDVVSQSQIIRTGFVHSVSGITPSTLKGKAKLDHPFSGIQYPVLVPNGNDEAFAIQPYVGYENFPFRTPYLKGVLVYHQDGTIEDLTPEEAASRPELVRTGRIVPESVARAEAEALSRSEEFEGDIHDADGNEQPFLTAIDENTTDWVTIIDAKGPNAGVKAIVLKNSSTGDTQVWTPPGNKTLISTEDVINTARALPLQWEEERCCDSDGASYTVKLREVVEPRLAFKDGNPYYLVTVVPTDDLALPREVEYTLLLDAYTGKVIDKFDHVSEGKAADQRLQAFFSD